MKLEDGLEAINKCINEVKKRIIVKLTKFSVIVIDKNGVKHMPDIEI